MKPLRGLLPHFVLLAVATLLAIMVWSRDEKAKTAKSDQVEVWNGKVDRLSSVSWEADKQRLSMEARKDSHGRWYAVTVDKTVETTPATPPPPHAGDAGPMASMGPDAGPPKPQSKRETQRFIAVTEADKLAESVAPMMALRALGKVDDARAEEFGLNKPDGTLRVAFDGQKHELVIGGTTPGGGDRYAKDPGSGVVYAISGEVVRNLQFAESRLMERELHAFKIEDVERVKLTKGTTVRELTRVADKKDGWADPATPDKLDETAGNWMAKIGRLRANQYVEQIGVDVAPEWRIVKIEYFDKKGKSIGTLELIRIPDDKSNAGYLVQTEHTRWYAQVLKSSAEEIQKDLASVLK